LFVCLAYDNVQPSTNPSALSNPTVVSFSQGTYVRTQLTGVYTLGGITYCVSPILGSDYIPQSKVIFWAVDINCCRGTYPYVTSNCPRWDLTPNVLMKGEIIKDTDHGYHTAVNAATRWHDFGTVDSPLFTSVLVGDMHEERQKQRKLYGYIIAGTVPFFWFVLGLFGAGIDEAWRMSKTQ
jgi:hypothetical protein